MLNPRLPPLEPSLARRGLSLNLVFLAIALSIFIPAFLFFVYQIVTKRQAEIGRIETEAVYFTRASVGGLERNLNATRALLVTLSRSVAVRGSDAQQCDKLLRDTLKTHRLYDALGVATINGASLCGAYRGIDMDGGVARSWPEPLRPMADISVGMFALNRVTKRPALDVAFTVPGMSRLLHASIDLKVWARINPFFLPDGATLTVIDRSGTVVLRHPDNERWIGRRFQDAELIRAALSGKSITQEMAGLDGVERFYGFEPLELGGNQVLYVVVGLPLEQSLAQIDNRLQRLWFVFTAIGIGASLTTWVFATQFVAVPIRKLELATQQLADGVSDARVTGPFQIAELNNLAQHFNAMVSSLQRRSAELSNSEDRFRQMAEGTGVALLVYRDARIVYANPAAVALTGYESERLTREADLEILGSLLLEQLHAYATRRSQALIAGDELQDRIEVIVKSAQGNDRTVDLSVGSIVYEGTSSLLVTMHDVTERVQAERDRDALSVAVRANRAKNEFLARMSHELRTPLTAILGFTQLLRMNEGDAERRDTLGRIDRTGKHLVGLINELLDLSSIEAGKLNLAPQILPIPEIIIECLRLLEPLIIERGVTVDASALAVCEVWADRQRVQQVLLNVLSNAVKYSPRGGLVRVACGSSGSSRVQVRVSDAGSGISLEAKRKLYEPFERLGATEEGTGLGLALSKSLLEAMGGRINLESTVGIGSTFIVTLPTPDAARRLGGAVNASSTALRVLCVDDDLAQLRLMNVILSQIPESQVCLATTGHEGLALARSFLPDVILLDLRLPDMPGEAVLEALKSDAATRQIAVIVVSASVSAEDSTHLIAGGARAVLLKPFRVHALRQLILDLTNRAEG